MSYFTRAWEHSTAILVTKILYNQFCGWQWEESWEQKFGHHLIVESLFDHSTTRQKFLHVFHGIRR